jgi:uncharacterized protein YoxC
VNWSDVAQIAQTLALLLIGGALVVLAVALARLVHLLSKVESSVARASEETRPLLQLARAIAEDLRAASARVRAEADRVGDLARRSVQGLDDTIEQAGHRLQRLNDLLDLVQDELEGAVIGLLSFVRGVRAGASVLRRRRRRRDTGDDETRE